jgi:shikimate dehydrogenase
VATLQCAVFGSPIAHSLSPRIHAAFAAQCHIALDYQAILASKATFEDALAQFASAGGMGANVTLPLKTDSLALCATLDAHASRAGAVNTLIRLPDAAGSARWHGANTDGIGLVRDLTERHQLALTGRRTLIIGAGGAARGVLGPLQDGGLGEVVIVNRSADKARALAELFGAQHAELADLATLGAFDFIVHASSAGHLNADAQPQWPQSLVQAGTVLVDLSYGQAAKPALAWACEVEAMGLDGLGMLIEQAAEAFFLWHGQRPLTAPVWGMLRAEL